MARGALRDRPGDRDGFYYDFELPGGAHFSDDDLARIDGEMRAIIAEDQPFTRTEYSIEEGLALFADQPFKFEIIERRRDGADRRGRRRSGRHVGASRRTRTRRPSPTCAAVRTCPRRRGWVTSS